jgi:hypothetical protein
MHLLTSKIGVTNNEATPYSVYVEPWGADFTLLPGQSLEIIAYGEHTLPWFELVQSEGTMQIHCEGSCTFEATQAGKTLECGHNRPAGSR